jgi:hypothetical protein
MRVRRARRIRGGPPPPAPPGPSPANSAGEGENFACAPAGLARGRGAPLSRPLPRKLRGGEVTRAAARAAEARRNAPEPANATPPPKVGGGVGRRREERAKRRPGERAPRGAHRHRRRIQPRSAAHRRHRRKHVRSGGSGARAGRPPSPASPPQTARGRGDARRRLHGRIPAAALRSCPATPPPKLGEGSAAVARNERKGGRGRGPHAARAVSDAAT